MAQDTSTPYQLWPHLSWLKEGDHQLKRTKPGHDLHWSFCSTSTVTSRQDLATCQSDLTHPRVLAQHASRAQKPHPGVSNPRQVTQEPASSSGVVIKYQTRHDVTTGSHVRLAIGTQELESIMSSPNKVALLHVEYA
jgi:hypothetical protein